MNDLMKSVRELPSCGGHIRTLAKSHDDSKAVNHPECDDCLQLVLAHCRKRVEFGIVERLDDTKCKQCPARLNDEANTGGIYYCVRLEGHHGSHMNDGFDRKDGSRLARFGRISDDGERFFWTEDGVTVTRRIEQ